LGELAEIEIVGKKSEEKAKKTKESLAGNLKGQTARHYRKRNRKARGEGGELARREKKHNSETEAKDQKETGGCGKKENLD